VSLPYSTFFSNKKDPKTTIYAPAISDLSQNRNLPDTTAGIDSMSLHTQNLQQQTTGKHSKTKRKQSSEKGKQATQTERYTTKRTHNNNSCRQVFKEDRTERIQQLLILQVFYKFRHAHTIKSSALQYLQLTFRSLLEMHWQWTWLHPKRPPQTSEQLLMTTGSR
jgi:hypothetical protein